MNNKCLSVGTIIENENHLFMIIGYYFGKIDGKLCNRYVIVKYPLGYMGDENTAIIPVDEEYKVVFEGALDEDERNFVEARQAFEKEVIKLNPDSLEGLMEEIKESMEKR